MKNVLIYVRFDSIYISICKVDSFVGRQKNKKPSKTNKQHLKIDIYMIHTWY